MLVEVGILLQLKLVQRGDILLSVLVIKGQQVGRGVIPVLEPGEEEPVHNVRIPVPLRDGRGLEQGNVL